MSNPSKPEPLIQGRCGQGACCAGMSQRARLFTVAVFGFVVWGCLSRDLEEEVGSWVLFRQCAWSSSISSDGTE